MSEQKLWAIEYRFRGQSAGWYVNRELVFDRREDAEAALGARRVKYGNTEYRIAEYARIGED